MKIAVNFSIDVTKLDKTRFKPGKNGAKYVDLTCFISPQEPDQYGQHGGIQQSTTQDERIAGYQMPFVGNCKAFWGEGVNIVKEANGQQAPQSGGNAPQSNGQQQQQYAPQQQQQYAPQQQQQYAPQQQQAPQSAEHQSFDDDIPF